MKNYRKTDGEYIEDYDRQTIKILKELETELGDSIYHKNQFENIPNDGKVPGWNWEAPTSKYTPFSRFFETAVRRAQNKKQAILGRQLVDENKDRLIRETREPQNIRCKACDSRMLLETYYFKENDTQLFFVFSCPNNHAPKRVMYPDGVREWVFPVSKCKKCGGKLNSEKVETKTMLRFTDTCEDCGESSVMEFNLDPEPVYTEEDRKKYVTDWIGVKSFEDDLEAISDFMKVIKTIQDKQKEKELLNFDKVEKVNLPKVEQRLVALAEELGYIKFKFDSHSTDKFLSVNFSAQDPTDRTEKESSKIITNAIQQSLFSTNWRLMNRGVDYRLGLITGKIRAYEGEEGLLKIAKEIFERNK